MNPRTRSFLVALLFIGSVSSMFAQAETVPATHPVYVFLKRMEVKHVVERYRDAVLPLSRHEVAEFLVTLRDRQDRLTSAERSILRDFLSEFQFEITGTTEGFLSVVDSNEPSFGAAVGQELTDREKFLYAMTDTNVTMFVNGLLTFDARRISGDALGSTHTEYVQFGGRIRGTIFGKLAYSVTGTNAQFWG
ncbi:MAG TPA: hypothetical protein VNL69_06065, partial [Bacteroidota bacterium]|nr:hypothetical protein [Bacteroidota bacterium]